jgi:hypothetical protein
MVGLQKNGEPSSFLDSTFEAQMLLIQGSQVYLVFSCVLVFLVSYLRIHCQVQGYKHYAYVFF